VSQLPQGTVTFAFTDIEHSTELLKRLGDEYRDVLTLHRKIVRDAFGACDGIEIDTQGDAFFFAFPRARDAVAAAVEAQRSHVSAPWPRGEVVRVRMGLHTGEPALHEEGYVGLDVVRAARICTEGKGGQILLSETTRALLGSGLPEGVSVFPLGQRHLRGIDEPERVYEIAIEGLAEVDEEREAAAAAGVEPAARTDVAAPPADAEVDERAAALGAQLSQSIQERVLQKLESKLQKLEAKGGSTGRGAPAPPSGSDVDDIADRMKSLGAEIDARVQAALAKRGRHPGQ
jgi:class 3 adenylate cyclase